MECSGILDYFLVKGGTTSQILRLILIVLDVQSITCLEEWNFIW